MLFDSSYACMLLINVVAVCGCVTPFDFYRIITYQAIYFKLLWTLSGSVLYSCTFCFREPFLEAEDSGFFQELASVVVKKAPFVLIDINLFAFFIHYPENLIDQVMGLVIIFHFFNASVDSLHQVLRIL